MIKASGCGAILDLDSLPIMDGAQEIITQLGITSTLHGGNRAAVSSIPDENHGAFELLFDPQTSGGLLISVPPEKAGTCVSALNDVGYESARIIGSVTSKIRKISFSDNVL
jgi:selenide,water dikinase